MSDLKELVVLAEKINASSIIPEHLRGPSELLAALLYVQDLGLPLMIGIQNVAIIKGKPTLSSHAIWGLAMRQPDFKEFSIKTSDTECTVTIVRSKGTVSETFSMKDAITAGLVHADDDIVSVKLEPGNKFSKKALMPYKEAKAKGLINASGWDKYPRKMLEARAKVMCGRNAYPEALMGIYSTEEISGGYEGDIIEVDPIGTKTQVAQSNRVSDKTKPSKTLLSEKKVIQDTLENGKIQQEEITKQKKEIIAIVQGMGIPNSNLDNVIKEAKTELGIEKYTIESLQDLKEYFVERAMSLKEALDKNERATESPVSGELFDNNVAAMGD